MEELISLAKRRGFFYQGSELYGGLAGTWDYGPLGVELARNVKDLWWQNFVRARSDIYGLDAAILMNPQVWEASGHVAGFHDPLVEDTKTKKRYRADHLLEEQGIEAAGMTVEEMDAALKEHNIKSPDGNPLGQVQQFNMMFKTQIGAAADSASISYLRPETAQGIFANFKNVMDSFHPSLPFGIAQIGKAFRNEITPRDFLFRVREFEQMEIEYFTHPNTASKSFEKWKEDCWQWLSDIGVDPRKLSWHEHAPEERAHYAAASFDIQYAYPFGSKELWGIANRTDFDLKAHTNGSGTKLEYFDQGSSERFVPYVIEPSIGLGRLLLALLDSAYAEEEVEGEKRVVLRFAPAVAPVKVAVLPLLRKDGLPEKAQEIFDTLKNKYATMYDETASIGKRYRRQDEIGTPLAITVDHDTLTDDAVTVRDRDTMQQERVAITDLSDYIAKKLAT
jgi:glycyl-tRNA synthetase